MCTHCVCHAIHMCVARTLDLWVRSLIYVWGWDVRNHEHMHSCVCVCDWHKLLPLNHLHIPHLPTPHTYSSFFVFLKTHMFASRWWSHGHHIAVLNVSFHKQCAFNFWKNDARVCFSMVISRQPHCCAMYLFFRKCALHLWRTNDARVCFSMMISRQPHCCVQCISLFKKWALTFSKKTCHVFASRWWSQSNHIAVLNVSFVNTCALSFWNMPH